MRRKKLGLILAVILMLTAGGCIWYINDYYLSEVEIDDYRKDGQTVQIKETGQGLWLDGAGEEQALIFYPGAKVEYTSYLPLMYHLAEEGVDCFLIQMPANLAIFGQNKAEKVMEEYVYENWYVGGHSLGGAMAASFASKNLDKVTGVVLLAAYPVDSLQADTCSVVSVYGSEDGVLNKEKITEARNDMPEDYREVCLEGGNHAGFGNYGEQKGDHAAIISAEEQQEQTVQAILEMTERRNKK